MRANNPATEKPQRTWLETTTTVLQALSAIAVPLAVAWIGFLIQQSIAKQTTAKDYVALAIDILKTEPKKDSGGDPLRDWAVDVLTLDSPVPISKGAQVQLRAKRLDIVVLPVDEDSLAKAFAALEKAISAKGNLKVVPFTTAAPSATP